MGLDRLALSLLQRLEPETAHSLAIRAIGSGLWPAARPAGDPALAQSLWGLEFPNPIGLAAGFDKDSQAFSGLLALGFGFVEVGTVTPRPQPGNPRPRLFRLRQDAALINRLGFNNQGADAAVRRLERRDRAKGIVGVNIGQNKDAAEPLADYAAGARRLGPLADYVVINVSSPNTPGLRGLQEKGPLTELIAGVRGAWADLPPDAVPPLLIKIAPDLDERAVDDICSVALAGGVQGLIVSNTTVSRPPSLVSGHAQETGGLSGAPLFDMSTRLLGDVHRRTGGRLPLIGVGGVRDGATAYAKIKAGASLVQLYTAFTYEGPGLIYRIGVDLAARLRADGFSSIGAAVGSAHR